MHALIARPVSLAAALLAAGCCAFVPCHRATALSGQVTDASGAPIPNAVITLYGIRKSERPEAKQALIDLAEDAELTLEIKSSRKTGSRSQSEEKFA